MAVPDNADNGDVSVNETAGIQSGDIRATRHALRLAQQYGVDLTKVKGTSRHGRVSQSDVEQYLQDVMGVRAGKTDFTNLYSRVQNSKN